MIFPYFFHYTHELYKTCLSSVRFSILVYMPYLAEFDIILSLLFGHVSVVILAN